MIVKPSIAFEDMRKSAGGVTASKNKARLYIKNRITPRNPKTERQMQVRSDLTSNSRAWQNLTQAQRDAWDEAAKTAYGRRELGEAAKISGFSLFMRCNQNLATIGATEVKVPGNVPDFPVFEMWGIAVTVTPTGTIKVTGNVPEDYENLPTNVVIRATAPFGAGRASNLTGLRIIKAGEWIDDVVNNPEQDTRQIDLTQAYTNVLGAGIKAGDKIQFEVYFIDPTSGYASLKQNSISTIYQVSSKAGGDADASVVKSTLSPSAQGSQGTGKVEAAEEEDGDGKYVTETVVNKRITRRPAK